MKFGIINVICMLYKYLCVCEYAVFTHNRLRQTKLSRMRALKQWERLKNSNDKELKELRSEIKNLTDQKKEMQIELETRKLRDRVNRREYRSRSKDRQRPRLRKRSRSIRRSRSRRRSQSKHESERLSDVMHVMDRQNSQIIL